MIMKDMRPLNIVESPGFVSLMKYLEPGYTLPCRKTFTTLIRSHQSAKLALKKYLEATSFISISTDIWTSLSTEAYITVTAHFILPSFDLQACVLETKVFPERHTGLNI